jgi:hypothetical protein
MEIFSDTWKELAIPPWVAEQRQDSKTRIAPQHSQGESQVLKGSLDHGEGGPLGRDRVAWFARPRMS